MSKYEPIAYQQTCGTCKHLDQSIILTTYPPQAYCTLFKKNVFVTNDKCLDDMRGKEE